MNPLSLGLVVAVAYGLFLGVKGSLVLWRAGNAARRYLLNAWAFFLLIPVLITFGYPQAIVGEVVNIWLAFPLLFLGIGWLFWGYFVHSVAKKTLLIGEFAGKHATSKKRLNLGLAALFLGIAVWCWGYFHGFAQGENWWLIFSLVAMAQGIAFVIRYR